MVNHLLKVNKEDNVATSTKMINPEETKNEDITSEQSSLDILDPIPMGHKVAVEDIIQGDPVVKYGEIIGTASEHIPKGSHVHTHNVQSKYG